VKSEEVKTGCNLVELSKEGCGAKWDVFLSVMMMMMIVLAVKKDKGSGE
jgi:hypothetical protein